MKNIRSKSEGVYTVENSLEGVRWSDVEELKVKARESKLKRARICIHQNTDEKIHEMLIALAEGVYVRPHRHNRKVESYLILEGKADLVIFQESGEIESIVPMGEPQSGKVFFNRVGLGKFHTFFLLTDMFVFKETTSGPFDPSETDFAAWAPDPKDEESAREFLDGLKRKIERFGNLKK